MPTSSSGWEHYLNNYKLPAWKELPDIGLYMDQVIALLGQYLDFHPHGGLQGQAGDPHHHQQLCPAEGDARPGKLEVLPGTHRLSHYDLHPQAGHQHQRLQQLLPSTADEEEIKNFYTSYVERLQEVGNFYTAQTRAAVQDILDPQVTDEGVVENVIIQSILQSGFSRIMAEKLLHLQDADPERVLELEKISDGRGRHPLGQLPEKEE